MPAAATVRLEGVTKIFAQDVVAVDYLDLDITPGSLVTLLGPSGCGKTTTLRMVAGLEKVSAGRILIDGEDVTRLAANHRDVTMVFQSYALFPHMSVFDNVAYGLRIAKVTGADLERRVRQEIRDLQQRLGITSVYVTHDQEEALAISDTIVVMQGGRIQQVGTPHELYTQPRNRFVADFIGSANFLPGEFDGKSVSVGPYRFALEQQDAAAGPVTVMIRPEAVRLTVADEAVPDEPHLPATISSASYLGVSTELILDTAFGEVVSSVTGEGRSLFARGDDVQVTFRNAGVYLLPVGEETA